MIDMKTLLTYILFISKRHTTKILHLVMFISKNQLF